MFEKYPTDSVKDKYNLLKFDLFSLMAEDLFKHGKLKKAIFTNNKILHEWIIGKINLLKENKLYLSFNAEAKFSYIQYAGKEDIEPGTPITFVEKKGILGLINSLIAFRDFRGAIKLCDQVLNDSDLEQYKYVALINKGFCLVNIGQFVDAINIYEESIQYNKEMPLIYRNLYHAWIGRYYAAVKHQKEFPIFMDKLFYYLIKAKKSFKRLKLELRENREENLEILEKIEKDIKNEFNSFYKQSLIKLEDSQIPNFLNYVREIDENHIKPIYNEHKERIQKILELEYFKFIPIYWNYLAVILLLINENDLALLTINKALKFLDEAPNKLVFLDTKAEILHRKKDYNEALDIFSKILEFDKDDDKLRRFYAETCWKAAKTAKKLGLYSKFQELLNEANSHNNDTYCTDKKIQEKIKKLARNSQ